MSNKVILEKLFKVAYNQQIILEKLANSLDNEVDNTTPQALALNLFIKTYAMPFISQNGGSSENHTTDLTDTVSKQFDVKINVVCKDKSGVDIIMSQLPTILTNKYYNVIKTDPKYIALQGFKATFNVTAS